MPRRLLSSTRNDLKVEFHHASAYDAIDTIASAAESSARLK